MVGSSDVRSLLDAIDAVRACTRGVNVDLSPPCICVIGNQSAGKSSILERLSGVRLPRGEGMVTKCALVLRMRRAVEPVRPFVEIAASGGEPVLIEKAETATHVERITNELVRGDDVNADVSIELTVCGEVPDLTLIDLPGIVYTSGDGAGATDIREKVKALYMKYMKDKTCVILCVMPANADAATNEALAWAREVDFEGERTVGVVTKIDKVRARSAARGGVRE